jgi:hypothetical protein
MFPITERMLDYHFRGYRMSEMARDSGNAAKVDRVLLTQFICLLLISGICVYGRRFVRNKMRTNNADSKGGSIKYTYDRRADGRTPLYDAVKLDRFDEVKNLLDGGHDGINKKAFSNGYTPFYLALFDNKSEIVQLMLNEKYGARFDLKTTSPVTEKAPHVLLQGCNFDSDESRIYFLGVLRKMLEIDPAILYDDKNIVYLFLKK